MEGTKYNLSITTSGENGDHASTNISTSNPAQLADILQLAGMQGGHPVAIGTPKAQAPEEHGSCDVCGGMHEDDEHVAEGESWDNEPDEVTLPPDSSEGNDLHKVKKTYPKVNGGDNPMALEAAESKLRDKWENFLAEDMETHFETELASPWKITEQSEAQKAAFQKMLDAKNGNKEEETAEETDEVVEEDAALDLRKLAGIVDEGYDVYVPSKEDVQGLASRAIAAITDLAQEGGAEMNVSVSTGDDEMPPSDDGEYHTDLGDAEMEVEEDPDSLDLRKLAGI
jgi:hypothetical protein